MPWNMRVVPLFETLTDLEESSNTMRWVPHRASSTPRQGGGRGGRECFFSEEHVEALELSYEVVFEAGDDWASGFVQMELVNSLPLPRSCCGVPFGGRSRAGHNGYSLFSRILMGVP